MRIRPGHVIAERFVGKALSGNPLGDPAEREIIVYLPPSYDKGSTRFPVVYCLAGFTGGARSWFNFQPWMPAIHERMDRLMARRVPETILVFPDCFTRYGGSQYLDSSAVGSYRRYLLQDVIPFVDRHFRTLPEARHRGIMGKSSGGYGALTLAMDHPDVFTAAACHSGDMYFEYCYLPDFPSAYRRLRKHGGLLRFLKNFDALSKTDKDDFNLTNIVAMSACYSPNPRSRPFGFDLPFDEHTGEINWPVWKRWKKKDPVDLLPRRAANLKKLRLLFLDCGVRDEFNLIAGARIFVRQLRKRKITHEYQEFEGGHFSIQHRYDVSLRMLAEALQ